MTDTERFRPYPPAEPPVPAGDDAESGSANWDLGKAWPGIRRQRVLIGGLLLIVAEVIWKAQFLTHMYLRRDDFVNQDIALTSPLNWHYLSTVTDGHLSPGLRGITWVIVRISLYNWGLDAALALLFVAAASLAALRMLRTLFGDRPVILIPLAIYALTPLTVPDLGWWWCAIESVPFQLAIFMMLNAHVLYVRTRRPGHLAAAAVWLVFSMLFFEKAMLLPPLLFAVTAGFLMERRSWLGGAALTLRRHWKGWLTYSALMVGYLIVFVIAFLHAPAQPHLPTVATTWAFGWSLVKNSLLTGSVGMQWRWLPFVQDHLYATVAPSAAVVLVAELIALAAIAASILIRARAWRAWAILLGWVIFADMVPILLGRVSLGTSPFYAQLFGLQTRYVADAACVLALCVGLAFLPAAGEESQPLRFSLPSNPAFKGVVAAIVVVFVIGSLRSVQTYENVTNSAQVRSYIANVEQALRLAPQRTTVIDQDMPLWVLGPYFGKYNLESYVIGTLAKNRHSASLHWITRPQGTLDSLRMFGSDGRLYPTAISGVYSVHRPGTGFRGCWHERKGRIVVWLQRTTSSSDVMLHLTYIWGAQASTVIVTYGTLVRQLPVLPGIHNAYLPVSGDVQSFAVTGLGTSRMYVCQSASGALVPFGTPLK